MFPFDLPLEVSLSVFVVIVFSVYVFVIMKVAPSEAVSTGGESRRLTQKPAIQSEALQMHAVKSAPRTVKYEQGIPTSKVGKGSLPSDRPTIVQRSVVGAHSNQGLTTPRVGKVGLSSDRPTILQRSVVEAHPDDADDDEKQKKSFFLFGKSNFQGCSHKFKFLSTLPKNTPIPEECFGCPDILECIQGKNKSASANRDATMAR
jgi:hypothetical protein